MYVKVWAKTEAKGERVEERSKDHFDVWVREPATQNLANKRIIALIAAHFAVPEGKVRIVNGHQSPSKLLSVGK